MDTKNEKKDFLLPASILIAAILIAGAVIYSTGAKNVKNEKQNIQEAAQQPSKPQIDDDVVLGNPDAPVTIFIFSDYQCPACGYFYQTIEPLLKKNYVETGKIKLVHKDFPLESMHPLARPAAEAAECAKDQGKYWQYHDALFEEREKLAQLNFIDLAVKLKLNKEEFGQCYNSRKYQEEVTADYNEGLKLKVDATPTIFIGEQKFRGVPLYETISQAIDEALNKK